MKETEIGGINYFTRRAPRGYGYEIIKSEKVVEKNSKRNLVFHSYDKDKIILVFDKMVRTGKLPKIFPDTSNEIPPPRVLIFDTKHFKYHYFVDTPEKLKKACIKILKERFDEQYYYMPDEPKNDSGIDSLEELDTIPDKFKGLTSEIQKKFNDYNREVRDYKSDMIDWYDLQIIVDGGDVSVGFVWNLISEIESENISLEDMDVVD